MSKRMQPALALTPGPQSQTLIGTTPARPHAAANTVQDDNDDDVVIVESASSNRPRWAPADIEQLLSVDHQTAEALVQTLTAEDMRILSIVSL